MKGFLSFSPFIAAFSQKLHLLMELTGFFLQIFCFLLQAQYRFFCGINLLSAIGNTNFHLSDFFHQVIPLFFFLCQIFLESGQGFICLCHSSFTLRQGFFALCNIPFSPRQLVCKLSFFQFQQFQTGIGFGDFAFHFRHFAFACLNGHCQLLQFQFLFHNLLCDFLQIFFRKLQSFFQRCGLFACIFQFFLQSMDFSGSAKDIGCFLCLRTAGHGTAGIHDVPFQRYHFILVAIFLR